MEGVHSIRPQAGIEQIRDEGTDYCLERCLCWRVPFISFPRAWRDLRGQDREAKKPIIVSVMLSFILFFYTFGTST